MSILSFIARLGLVVVMSACTITGASATALSYITLDAPTSLLGVPGDTFFNVKTQLYGINDQGQIIGQITGTDENILSTPQTAGFLYSKGTFIPISLPDGQFDRINDAGQIGPGINNLGQTIGGVNDTAFVLSNGVSTPLDLVCPTVLNGMRVNSNSGDARPHAINDAGIIVGGCLFGDIDLFFGFEYSSGMLNPIDINVPNDINNRGQIVGDVGSDVGLNTSFCLGGGGSVLLDPNGNTTTLNDPNTTIGCSTYAFGINNMGDIVGFYQTLNGTIAEHGFLAVPVPEPGSASLMGIALLFVAGRRYRGARIKGTRDGKQK